MRRNKERYAVAHVNNFGDERFLIKGINQRGTQYATDSEARGELSDKLCIFSSVEEIVKFIEGDPFVRPIHHIPHIFRLTPSSSNSDLNFFRIYRLNKGIPESSPVKTFKSQGINLIEYK